MKETTKIGTLCLNGLAIFLTIIFVISIVTMSGNTVSVQAETIKSQRNYRCEEKNRRTTPYGMVDPDFS